MSPPSANMIAALLLPLAVAGCSLWKSPGKEPSKLPLPRMAADAVVLEIATIHVPAESQETAEGVWQEADELHLDVELRRELTANGVRCGLLGSALPDALHELMIQDDNKPSADGEAGPVAGSDLTTTTRIQSRRGQRNRIITTPTREQLHVMTIEDGQVCGRSYKQAHGELSVKTFPQDNGLVRLEITPEVHHGQAKQVFVGGENSFVPQVLQDRTEFAQLRIETTIGLGQTLIISCTSPATGLGGSFFAETSGEKSRTKLLLIRLAQTQLDDLFAPGQVRAPIVTPTQ